MDADIFTPYHTLTPDAAQSVSHARPTEPDDERIDVVFLGKIIGTAQHYELIDFMEAIYYDFQPDEDGQALLKDFLDGNDLIINLETGVAEQGKVAADNMVFVDVEWVRLFHSAVH
jgi:hypothetical protein